MTETVRIRSRLHPAGRVYELVPADSLAVDELGLLVELSERANASRGSRIVRNLRVSRLLGRAVRIVLPDLEPFVLRRLGDDERRAILNHWAEAS